MPSIIGLDISKHTVEVATLHRGGGAVHRSRFPARPDAIRAFARTLETSDQVVIESCTNAVAFHRQLCQHAGRVVLSNPLKTRVIAEAKVKTDKVDAEVLARLLAADFLPTVWVPDPLTDELRHWVFHRQGLVTQRTQAKNRIHAILHRNLIAPTMTDLFGKAGRTFLGGVELPPAERALLEADLRTIDFLNEEVAAAEQAMARAVHQDAEVQRLLSVPGIALASAVGLRAAIGDVKRFASPAKLVSYFGPNPSVYQTGMKAYTGHISRRGRSHARAVCIEVAHQLAQAPGPFHALFVRLRRRKPYNVAIIAVARKFVTLVWHMLTHGEDYHYAPPGADPHQAQPYREAGHRAIDSPRPRARSRPRAQQAGGAQGRGRLRPLHQGALRSSGALRHRAPQPQGLLSEGDIPEGLSHTQR
jgi:transposase